MTRNDGNHGADRAQADYAKWLPEDWRIVVVVDRDDDDCRELKKRLEADAASAGLRTRAKAGKKVWQLVSRVAIEELEAWYFGGWDAVRSAYPRVRTDVSRKEGFRDPDAIAGGTWEAFEQILQKHGYFDGGLRKTEAARTLGAVLHPDRCTSRSFAVFRDVLREATA